MRCYRIVQSLYMNKIECLHGICRHSFCIFAGKKGGSRHKRRGIYTRKRFQMGVGYGIIKSDFCFKSRKNRDLNLGKYKKSKKNKGR